MNGSCTKKIEFSIVIATYNRAQLLAETLASLDEHLLRGLSSGTVEVILVDNNCSDHTREVMREYSARYDFVHVHKELKQGLSSARNSGIGMASGEIVIFLDDDVELDCGWFDALTAPFSDASIGVVGGKVLPFGSSQLPDWLPREYGYLVSVFDPADAAQDVRTVMGANFAVRRSCFERVGTFDTSLGRRGDKLLGGEEVELFGRIARGGWRIRYTPSAVVYHKIESKLRREYIDDYAFWLGVSEAHVDKSCSNKAKFLMKYVRSLFFPMTTYPLQRLFWPRNIGATRYAIKVRYAAGYVQHLKAIRS